MTNENVDKILDAMDNVTEEENLDAQTKMTYEAIRQTRYAQEYLDNDFYKKYREEFGEEFGENKRANVKYLLVNLAKLRSYTSRKIQNYKEHKKDGKFESKEVFCFIRQLFSQELVIIVHSILDNIEPLVVDGDIELYRNEIKNIIREYIIYGCKEYFPWYLKFEFVINIFSSILTDIVVKQLLRFENEIK